MFLKHPYQMIRFRSFVSNDLLQWLICSRKDRSMARCAQGRRLADDFDYAKRLKPVNDILNRQRRQNNDRDLGKTSLTRGLK